MTVEELIQFLKKQPQNLQVIYRLHSEQCLLESDDIRIEKHCYPRHDGWVHDYRPDKESKEYLVFPGN